MYGAMLSSKFDTEVWYQLITNFDTEFKMSLLIRNSPRSHFKKGVSYSREPAVPVSEAKRNWKHPWFAIS